MLRRVSFFFFAYNGKEKLEDAVLVDGEGRRTEQQVQELQSLCEPQVVQALKKHVSHHCPKPTPNSPNPRRADLQSGILIPRVHF